MQFTKMHGAGNDYVYVNCFEENVPDPAQLAIAVSDRHKGIGADGLVLICPTDKADVQMRMFNADGSESEMCGNAVRCVSKYSYDRKLLQGRDITDPVLESSIKAASPDSDSYCQITVLTGNGLLDIALAVKNNKVEFACVNMGNPILTPFDIPVTFSGTRAVNIPIEVLGNVYQITCVSMGNPHAVAFCEDVSAIELEKIGPAFEHHSMFPRRINVHFVQVKSKDEVIMRTWERGSGITLACGTGASAVCVAGVLTENTSNTILAHLPGGDLTLSWNKENDVVYMTGPATEVFTGEWPM